MTNEKELREDWKYVWERQEFMPLDIADWWLSKFHSHTQEVVEKIELKLSYALYNLKNSIRHEREGTNIHGHENDLDRDLQDLDDVLALLKEDNK